MKKRVLRTCVAAVMVVAMAFVAMPERWAGQAGIVHQLPYWDGGLLAAEKLPGHRKDDASLKTQAELENKIAAQDEGYNRDEALKKRALARERTERISSVNQSSVDVGLVYKSLFYQLDAPVHSSQPTCTVIPSATPTTQPTQPTPTPSTPSTPTPAVPDPVTPVQYETPTSYYFTSSGDQWQEVWYNTSSLMYLRGSVPADCDTSRTDCWQLSFDLDGETVTVQGNGCMDWRGTSLDVSFNFDDDLINEVESYFIKGGDNVPVTFRYYAGNTLKKASVAGQPKLMLTYDGWLKLYVVK